MDEGFPARGVSQKAPCQFDCRFDATNLIHFFTRLWRMVNKKKFFLFFQKPFFFFFKTFFLFFFKTFSFFQNLFLFFQNLFLFFQNLFSFFFKTFFFFFQNIFLFFSKPFSFFFQKPFSFFQNLFQKLFKAYQPLGRKSEKRALRLDEEACPNQGTSESDMKTQKGVSSGFFDSTGGGDLQTTSED